MRFGFIDFALVGLAHVLGEKRVATIPGLALDAGD
jgi:hypothetical protein